VCRCGPHIRDIPNQYLTKKVMETSLLVHTIHIQNGLCRFNYIPMPSKL
jgi:hypothetical protein